MKLHIANFFDAPNKSTCLAGAAIAEGAVIKVAGDANGVRRAATVGDGDAALLVKGNYGVAYKVSKDPLAVTTSTADARLGDRTLQIASGDWIVQVGPGAILEYDVSLLHNSLNPGQGGALPAPGVALGIKSGTFCTAATGSAIVSPVVGRVFDVLGSKVRIELV